MCAVGIKALRKIQFGIETAHAVNTTATARFIGKMTMKNEQKYFRPEDYETGKLSSYEYSGIVSEQAKLTLEADASYEQLGYILGMGVIGGITGGSPSDSLYTRTYKPNLTSANNVDTYTIQYGNDVQAFLSPYCFAQDFEISGSMDDSLKVKANIIGQNVRTGSFTSVAANPATLTHIPASLGKLYIDTSWAGLGGTLVPGTLIDFAYKVTPGIFPAKYADGNIYFSEMMEKKRHIELNVTYAFTSGVAGYFANYIASPQTKQFIRIKFLGPLVGVSAKDELDLDGCFIIDDYDTLEEREGQDIVKLKLVSIYDVTGTSEWQIVLKNGVSALP